MVFSSKQRQSVLVLYFLLTCVLFCLPGSAFPKETWLDKIGFDKWVHIGLFLSLTHISCWALQVTVKKTLIKIFLFAVVYGIVVELVQDQFIPNRSMDLGDWAADIIGGFIGVWFWNLRYIKK
jgi:VanZ family protein